MLPFISSKKPPTVKFSPLSKPSPKMILNGLMENRPRKSFLVCRNWFCPGSKMNSKKVPSRIDLLSRSRKSWICLSLRLQALIQRERMVLFIGGYRSFGTMKSKVYWNLAIIRPTNRSSWTRIRRYSWHLMTTLLSAAGVTILFLWFRRRKGLMAGVFFWRVIGMKTSGSGWEPSTAAIKLTFLR